MAYKSKFKGKEIDDKLDLVQELSEDISDIKEYIKNIPQEEIDPIFSKSPAAGITENDKEAWNNKVDAEDINDIKPLIVDFSINDISAYIHYGTEFNCNSVSIIKALQNKQPIYIPYENERLEGYYPVYGFIEDLIYLDVFFGNTVYKLELDLSGSGIVSIAQRNSDNFVDKSDLANIALTGDYNDLKNKPTIPAEQVNADWNATSGKAQILNKPTIPSAVTESTVSSWGFTKNTGNYTKPSSGIPQSDLTNDVQKLLNQVGNKQDNIEDLEDIRDGAEKGASSIQGVRINETTADKDAEGIVDLGNIPNITASQIFLELHTVSDNFQIFSHKIGYEEHNRKVCHRLIENCFGDKMPNNEIFFVTINGSRDRSPYMETSILEYHAEGLVGASFVKGDNSTQSSSIVASIGFLSIDAETLRNYVESGEDAFYWKYISIRDESDVYVTEFNLGQITTNGTAVSVSPELVSAIYNNRIIVIPGKRGYYIATNTYSASPDSNVGIEMQIATGTCIYIVWLGAKGPAPQTVRAEVGVIELLSGTLNTINGISLAKGADMQLVSSISLNGKTYTPSNGAVDLGNIEGTGEQQQFKTIFGNSIVGEGDILPDYSMEITAAGTYTVESVVNPRIMRGGSIYSLIVEEWITINNGPRLDVRISSDGILDVSGVIGGIQTSYLASGVIPEEYMPKNVATLDDIKQADFEETDVESKAYIKNKTHWFYPYTAEQQLVANDTTVGTNLFSLGNYFKLGGAVYRSADMLGVEFNCQNSGMSVFVTVVEELDIDVGTIFYLRHISGNSSYGAPIMFSQAGNVKTIDSAFIPENFATKGYVETAIAEAITSVINASY